MPDVEEDQDETLDEAQMLSPATKADVYIAMLSMRLNQVIMETALIAIERGDDDLLKKKIIELSDAGSDFNKLLKRFGSKLEPDAEV